MNVNELIAALQAQANDGRGETPVKIGVNQDSLSGDVTAEDGAVVLGLDSEDDSEDDSD